MLNPVEKNAPLSFPIIASVIIHNARVCVLTTDGEIVTHQLGDRFSLSALLKNAAVLTCHAPWISQKLDFENYPAYDILELFAFCHPAVFITPTLHGLAKYYSLPTPFECDDAPFILIEIAQALLGDLQSLPEKEKAKAISIAQSMGQQSRGWAWTPYVLEALGERYNSANPTNPKQDFNIFEAMVEWSEEAPPPPHKFSLISGDETRDYLKILLQRRETAGRKAELRSQQVNYATRIADHFTSKPEPDSPHLLVAQAGTGIGKTYGYLAPAQLWAEKNEGQVTVSTYTKNLQRQIEQDLDILYPDKSERERKSIIQKGRENYLCLLNLDDLIASSVTAQNPRTIIAAGLMARWVMSTSDGDLTGNSFPGWLSHLLGVENSTGLADRRGECIYAACTHYHKCFIEGMNRKAKRARIVINNHALTMIRAATERQESISPFIIFDEAHHLFQAADSAYGADFTGMETADLRRWILGPEDETRKGQSSSRGRGLRKRLEGLVTEDSPAYNDIAKIIVAAKECLPAPLWRKRVFMNEPFGVLEDFLSALASHVSMRSVEPASPYSIECDIFPLTEDLIIKAKSAHTAFKKLRIPLQDLSENLKSMMEDKADTLDKDTLSRLDNLSASIERRSTLMVAAWMSMLETIIDSRDNPDMIDWFEIDRLDGKNFDCGMIRRFKNPMHPFGNSIRHTTHGVIMTSATLRSDKGIEEQDWIEAEQNLGIKYLSNLSPVKIDLPSPFQYAQQSKILIVTDIDKSQSMSVANAFKAIFEASKGGGLGLFTSIQRLRQVHRSIKDALERQSISVYAQHSDNIDIGTLTDMFRDDMNACLLGTDAVRDGIDVAGGSLRCMVFDRVPWPRPTILHRERRNIFGGRTYDENQTKMKLKQAYGRLIRSETDKGVFIMLDGAMPTRLCDAFPEGVEIQRLKLKDALKEIKSFLD